MDDDSTAGLSVEIVRLERIPDENLPPTHKCGFAYTIRINNDSDRTVRLMSRKWMIKHASGALETVEGDGVVGRQPAIGPGQSHTYTSYCLLFGETGAMWGFYFGRDDNDNPVLWRIPKFDMSIAK